jgi:DNA invertase Pin-like site-specific DNA recombinase
MTKTAAIYARYSDVQCSVTSIEDQVDRCRTYAAQQGWNVTAVYADREISGQSAGARPEFLRLRKDAERGKYNVVLAEAPDRLARRVADLTDLRDVLQFAGVELHAVSMGLITPLHAAVMGMVAEQYSRDLADKTKRGQIGSTKRGKIAAGLAYGYATCAAGPCNRVIDPAQALVVVRIFSEFADGVAPNTIAARLNADGVAGPRGEWNGTTIRGDAARQTGILRNRLYIGEITYGRTTFRKDPRTGKRLSKVTGDAIVEAAPGLRIVDDALWARVEKRLEDNARKMARDESGQALNRAHRAQYVLSGLLFCGCCDGSYAIMGKDRYGCSSRKNRRTCDNGATITRQAIETRVLAGIKRGLLAPGMVESFVAKVTVEMKTAQAQARSDEAALTGQLVMVRRKIERLLDQIEDGAGDAVMLGERLKARETERREIEARLVQAHEANPAIVTLPNFASAYADMVRRLEDVLRDATLVQRAHETLARLIEKVVLTPDPDAENGLRVDLHGQVAAILQVCASADGGETTPSLLGSTSQVSVVAGAGFEPATFRL